MAAGAGAGERNGDGHGDHHDHDGGLDGGDGARARDDGGGDGLEPAHVVALDRCADCAERRPFADGEAPADGETVAVALATYELDKASGRRKGRILPCAIAREGQHELRLRPPEDAADLAGVFDIKWSADGDLLASAHADGTCQVRKSQQAHEADPLAALQLSDEDLEGEDGDAGAACFCLSLDWNDRAGCAPGDARLAVSRSDGKLSVLALRSSGLENLDTWDAHAYPGPAPAEVWITAFDCFDPEVLISGADEAKLKVWDMRVGSAAPIAVCKGHDAGVCSAQFHPRKPHVLATGSYDSQIRIWDRRNLKTPTSPPLDTGGGVWRLKWHPKDDDRILAAAMRSGFLENVLSDSGELTTVRAYRENFAPGRWEALGYGVDWLRIRDEAADFVVGASFYDRKGYLFSTKEAAQVDAGKCS